MDPIKDPARLCVAQIVVARPLPGPLSYLIPEDLLGKIRLGSIVKVPFRNQTADGFVVGFTSLEDPTLRGFELKEVLTSPFDAPVFSKLDLDFFMWVADYYQLPLGEVFHSAFPKSIFDIPKRKTASTQELTIEPPSPEVTLTDEQGAALKRLNTAILKKEFQSFLLFGVTGSGKTELYIRSAEQALKQGMSALILVPEIALTPQLRTRFESRFSENVAVLHSSLGDKTRREYWWDILTEKRKIVVGARSAVFAPLKDIGLIVVDEEHEPSYKQEDRLRYNARDLALLRAKQHKAVAILGSATPSIETFYAATTGKHELLELTKRPLDRPLPTIEVIDLKTETEGKGKKTKTLLGKRLQQELQEALVKGEQAILFVNRKGFANFLLCADCGEVPKCLNCSVSLTYYQKANQVKCHYCGYAVKAPSQCAACSSIDLQFMGLGSELVELEAKRLFPQVTVARLDAETADSAKKAEAILGAFRKGETKILVGTQMLAKGHDFPGVTVVGVIMADFNLHLPDFRSAERTFQLLAQVSGRAGRGSKPGKVILQTYLPDHYVIQTAAEQNYRKFYASEIDFRRDFGYPPFKKIAQLEFRSLRETEARMSAERIRSLLEHLGPEAKGFEFLGPAAASIAKVANQFRWQILLRSEKSSALNAVIKTLRKEGVRFIDVDPASTL